MSTKQELLAKIVDQEKKRTVILPMDHGVSDGPIPGLINMAETIIKVKEGGVDAIVLHKGVYKHNKEVIGDLPTLIHISASSVMGVILKKVIVATPLEISQLGAQGVSMHINFGNKYDPEMLADLGRVSRECEEVGLPLLVMIYPRDEVDGKVVTFTEPEKVAHAARVAFELGADIVKVPYTGDALSFKQVCAGVPIPVVIAGGAKGSEEVMLQSIRDCVAAGAAGVSVGRNAFQADDVVGMVKKIRDAVYS